MEQPCHKCGQAVEEGIPFCPHCAAPQIRVVLAEPPAAHVFAAEGIGTAVADSSFETSEAIPPVPVAGSHMFKPCALAALVGSILVSVGLNPFVAMIGVGFLGVLFYKQRLAGAGVRPGTGAVVGAVSGAFWFVLSSVVGAVVILFLHKTQEVRDQLITKLNQAATQTSDPQTLAIFDRLKSPDGIEFLMIAGLIFAFLLSIILASVGGALGAAIVGRRGRS
jgi:hypothetical protein